MTEIAVILARISKGTTSCEDFTLPNWIRSSDSVVQGLPGVPDPVRCPYCGKVMDYKGRRIGSRVYWAPSPEPCTCPGAVSAAQKEEQLRQQRDEEKRREDADRKMRERVKALIGASGMSRRFLDSRFSNFEITPCNKQAAEAAKRFAGSFPQSGPGRNGLFIVGPPGVGKTHLAAAISNTLLAKGTPVICMTAIDLLQRIRSTYRKREEDEAEILKMYKEVPLLVVDDLGKEAVTEWASATLYSIINGRYEAYAPTIVTTNYAPDLLEKRLTPPGSDPITAKATLDRLMEMCHGIAMDGESWRCR